MKHAIGIRWLAIPIEVVAHSPHEFWSTYEYLIYYQNEDSCAH